MNRETFRRTAVRKLLCVVLLAALVPSVAGAAEVLQFQFTSRKAAANSIQVADIRLLQNGVVVPFPAGTTAASDGTYPSGEGPANVLDGEQYSKYLRFTTETGTAITGSLTLTFPTAPTFNQIQLRTANDSTERDLNAFTVRYGGAVVATVTNANLPDARLTWSSSFTLSTTPPVVVPPVTPPATYQDVCLPEFKVDIWNMEFELGNMPAGANARYPKYVAWREKPSCGNRVRVQPFTLAEADEYGDQEMYQSDNATNAWARARTFVPLLPAEKAALQAIVTAYAASLPARPDPVAAPQYTVAAITAGTRPAYQVTNGAVTTTKTGDVKVGQACNCTALKIVSGSTTRCAVSGLADAKVANKVIPASSVSVCALKTQ